MREPTPHLDGLLDRHEGRRRIRIVLVAVLLTFGLAWLLMTRQGSEQAIEVAPDVPVDRLQALVAPDFAQLASEADLEPVAGDVPDRSPRIQGVVEPGKLVFPELRRLGASASSVHRLSEAMKPVFDFRRSRPGHRFDAEVDRTGTITRFSYQVSPETVFEARLNDGTNYEARRVDVPVVTTTAVVTGRVTGSFLEAVTRTGETAALGQKVVDILQWDLDFSRDVRPGDAFRILVEKVHLDGELLRYGRVLAVEYRGARVSRSAYWFEEEGVAGHFGPDGAPLRRMFLAAPCRYRRISSRFDMNRMHPVLKVRRPHLGVDYAAPTGTPVWAMADGTVTYAGFKGPNGNLVTIRHAGGYETGYAHLHRFARGLRSGQKVRQGEVIGFVGNTGRSTGPHLHFGMKHHGRYIDPLGRSEARQPGLGGRALTRFKRELAAVQARLAEAPLPEVAPETSAPDDAPDSETLDDYSISEF